MEKEINLYPKNWNLRSVTVSNVSQIVYKVIGKKLKLEEHFFQIEQNYAQNAGKLEVVLVDSLPAGITP